MPKPAGRCLLLIGLFVGAKFEPCIMLTYPTLDSLSGLGFVMMEGEKRDDTAQVGDRAIPRPWFVRSAISHWFTDRAAAAEGAN
jgi:hypothetical protein